MKDLLLTLLVCIAVVVYLCLMAHLLMTTAPNAPIDMILYCPDCGAQHVDAPEPPDWTNPPHRSHLCGVCKRIWRPADVFTNGVAAIKTRGAYDGPPAPPFIEKRRAP